MYWNVGEISITNSNNVKRPPDEETLQEQVDEQKEPTIKKFGTFSGVFTPTLLTILGVIMYLRQGWVVGNAGLLGAWAIILISFGITFFTALSLSSITTNIRIGAGGAFSIISQSLGLEVGGSVGIPLYLSQALAVAMYIFGFRAGWQWVFPDHPAILIDLGVFVVLFIIAYISASLAFRIQYIILAVIIASLISVAAAAYYGPMGQSIELVGSFPGSPENGFTGIGFWAVFAVFFPAATGIMAGANMSGELKEPRKNIPIGTLSAIVTCLVIYLALAYWFAVSASPDELVSNYNIMIERAAWEPVVLAGLLGATFSSALTSIVGAPRILQALGNHQILPKSQWFAERTQSGEPRNAMLVTGLIVFFALMLRDLNAIAPLITMFFLITYAMINVVVFIEQSLKLVSFRPLFRIPRMASFLGAAGSLFAMFIINPIFSLVAVAVVIAIHGFLLQKHLKAPFGDVRSGLFVALAEWAAKKVNELAPSNERTWKANLLTPVEDPQILRKNFNFIKDITYPKGSVKILGLTGEREYAGFSSKLAGLTTDFQNDGIFSSWTIIDTAKFEENLVAGMEALSGSFFKPSLIFLNLPGLKVRDEDIKRIIQKSSQYGVGVLLFVDHPKAGLGRRQLINVWINNKGPNWELRMDLGNIDLALLVAYKLKRNWQATMSFVTTVEDPEEKEKAQDYLKSLAETARIPNIDIKVLQGSIRGNISEMPLASINIFSLPEEPDLDVIREIAKKTGSACLFCLDSGNENALA